MTTVNCIRGCGTRVPGGTYLCTGQGFGGSPIEKFIIDPPILAPMEFQRGFKIIKLPKYNHSDVLIFVGKSFYKSPWDFIEESRKFGISRKVSRTFPFDKLTPSKSRMLFVHSKGYPYFDYELNRIEKPKDCKFKQDEIKGWHSDHIRKGTLECSACTYSHQDLAVYLHKDAEREILPDSSKEVFNIKMPGFKYSGVVPNFMDGEPCEITWEPAIFLATYITHIEYPMIEDPHSVKQASNSGFDTLILDY